MPSVISPKMMAPSNVRAMMLSRVDGGSCSACTIRVSDVGFSMTGCGGLVLPCVDPNGWFAGSIALFVSRRDGRGMMGGISSGGGLGCACWGLLASSFLE